MALPGPSRPSSVGPPVTGSLALPAFYLFAIVFFWTPPHFWALSLLLKDDYERVGVPMLPVVMGVSKTKKAILLYAILLMALTSMFFVTGAVGWLYLGTSLFLGSVFVYSAARLLRSPGIEGALGTYVYSLAYLFLLFAAIAVDASISCTLYQKNLSLPDKLLHPLLPAHGHVDVPVGVHPDLVAVDRVEPRLHVP